jgi:4-amino-4-deoxy-L-arabinose transferase-like glycosyltransferase
LPAPHPASVEEDSRLQRFLQHIEPYDVWLVFGLAVCALLPGIWSYTLIDPWETHYSEVARRMLQDGDWVKTQFSNEAFRSKPVLTCWLIAASFYSLGIAQDGGYSGELVGSASSVIFAARLPFVLFGALGIALTWWALARLVNRRLASIAALVIATTTFYFMIARQAITDIPMVACAMGAIACLAMTIERGEQPLEPIAPRSRWRGLRRLDAHHVFLAFFILVVGGQALYYAAHFSAAPLARGVKVAAPSLTVAGPMIGLLVGLVIWNLRLQPVSRRGQLWMFWFYALVGIAVLAKGPSGLGIVGLVSLSYLVLSGRWSLLRRFEIPRGILIASLIALPWHIAMFLRDGPPWLDEYLNYHILGRFASGVHGDRGTFEYLAAQLGIGMWPWSALVPAALAACLFGATFATRSGRLRLIVGIWAIAGMALFSISQTKFHHYISPIAPALGISIAFFLDDLWARRIRNVIPAVITAIAITAILANELMGEQEKLIELFIYRHDRPWPTGDPWNLDITGWLFGFAALFSLGFALLLWGRARRWVIGGLLALALGWLAWGGTGYMQAAAPHWGMGGVIKTYYDKRQIHGVEIKYWGLRELHADWNDGPTYRVKSHLSEGFAAGAPMRVTLEIPDAGLPENRIVLRGRSEDVGDSAFTIRLDPGELDQIAHLIAEGASARPRPAWHQVDADRLMAWLLRWRGENFWTADEIWGRTPDTRTVFNEPDNKAFLAYLEKPEQIGRTFYLITESGRARGLKGLLPTARAKETYELVDTSGNKFTLLRFTL